jgi:hypothetical protein
MNTWNITMVYVSGTFEQDTRTIETEMDEFDLHYIIGEAFDCDWHGSSATIVKKNVWQVTMNGAVFIIEKA